MRESSIIVKQQQLSSTSHQQEGEDTQIIQFSLALNDKLNSLDRKSNRLLQKVLSIQQQIQSYAQTQSKQFLPISSECFSSRNNHGNSINDSMYTPRRNLQMCTQSQQHQQYVKKMVNLGRSKVKMIENLQQHILKLENKFNNSDSNNSNSKNNANITTDKQRSASPKKKSIQHQHLTHQQQKPSVLTIIQDIHFQQNIQEDKKQLDNKFTRYNNHKNDMLKQSKTQRFSFRQLKNLMKKQKIDQQQQQQQQMHNNKEPVAYNPANKSNKTNQQLTDIEEESPLLQLMKVKQQFAAYQQRTSKQLQTYKQRLNHNILEKEVLRKQLQREKYDHLRDNLFSSKSKCKSTRSTSSSKLRRILSYPKSRNKDGNIQNDGNERILETNENINNSLKQHQSVITHNNKNNSYDNQQHHAIGKKQQHIIISNDNNIEDLQRLRDELSMRYVQENEEISQLKERLAESEQKIEQLREKLTQQTNTLQKQRNISQQNHYLYLQQLQQLHLLLQQKQRHLRTQQQQLQQQQQQTNQYKQQIQQMNCFIIDLKEQNQHQHEEIEEYKTVVEEFLEEVGRLRNQLINRNNELQQYQKELQQAGRINKQCYQEISILKEQLESQFTTITQHQHLIEAKQTKINQLQSAMKKHKLQLQQLQQQHHMEMVSQQLHNNDNTYKDDQISQLLTQIQMNKQFQQEQLHNIQRLNELLEREKERMEEIMKQHIQQIKELKITSQMKINQMTLELNRVNSSKQQQLQELQQNIILLKENINEQVQKQVNQAIRTFLRYRKHTCRLQSKTVRMIIHYNQLYPTQEQITTANTNSINTSLNNNNSNNSRSNARKNTRYNNNSNNKVSDNRNQNKPTSTVITESNISNPVVTTANNSNLKPQNNISNNNSNSNNNNNSSNKGHRSLTLRKLIDSKFNLKREKDHVPTQQQQLMIKMNFILKLIEKTMQFLKQQLPANNKSATKTSSKKLPSLLPDSICILLPHKDDEQSIASQQLSLQQTIDNFLNYISITTNQHQYEFCFIANMNSINTSNKPQPKKDKTLIYCSPEVLLSMNQSEHSYTWTLGILIDEILNHKPYYTKIEDIISRKDNYKFNNLQHYQNPAIDPVINILQHMLKKNFRQRSSLQAIHKQLVEIINNNSST